MANVTLLIPNPLASDRQFSRFYHHDLSGMETEDLWDELNAIQSQMWFVKSDRFMYMVGHVRQRQILQWLRERKAQIRIKLGNQRRTPWEDRRQPKSKPELAKGVIL
jgi:hypothetical protein